MMEKEGVIYLNTANKLTMIRVVIIPIFLAVLYIGFENSNYVAMAIFILANLTDIADGQIARRRGQVTDFGKFTDPLADKVLVVSAMLWFVAEGIMPVWVALLVIIREFMVTALRLFAAGTGRVIAAALSGKIKTVVTVICLSAMFLQLQPWMVYSCIFAITMTTLVSGIEYFVRNRDIMKLDM